MRTADPYDELPYKCLPIEWTAPERLALASLLHGGPRAPLDDYRVLELGCGNGANLLPQAYYRRHAAFVGVDGAGSQIAVADSLRAALGLANIEFVHTDFKQADDQLVGQFDYIIGHGVFSWVPHTVRDALLRLCARRLRPGGLLYLNYNSNPGWKVRGMVRDFLLDQTAGVISLGKRARAAQEAAARVVASVPESEHPYSKLISNEFKFVCENDASYIAHEYLTRENHAYWRSEFMALTDLHGLEYIADADFNYTSRTVPDDVLLRLSAEQITGHTVEDTRDLLCYRQLHSPILTTAAMSRRQPTRDEFGRLHVASCLTRCEHTELGPPVFQHPSGYQVEAREAVVQDAFERLAPIWPTGIRVDALFPDVGHVMEDLRLLHRNGLIELRCVEMWEPGLNLEPLKKIESLGGYFTTPYHTRHAAVA